MKRFILDASVGLSWFLDDPVPELAQRVKKTLENGATALVPQLWKLEVANGFVIAERRGILGRESVDSALDHIEALLASVIDVSSVATSLRRVHLTARRLRLTAYDTVYLETAMAEGLPLATLDQELRRAAADAGVPLFS